MTYTEELYTYLYINKCPKDVDLIDYSIEQGCQYGMDNQDLQICRNCWQNAIARIDSIR